MADRTVKSDDTNDLVLSNNDGSAKIEVNEAQNIILTGGSTTGLTIDTSGNTTLAGTANDIGTVTSGTFNGTIGTSASGSSNLPAVKTALNASGDAGIYACRAWVQFSNSGTRTGYGNVSSVTDEAQTGQYSINFENGMGDDNYAFAGMIANTTDNWSSDSTGATRGPPGIFQNGTSQPAAGSCKVQSRYGTENSSDGNDIEFSQYTVVFFR